MKWREMDLGQFLMSSTYNVGRKKKSKVKYVIWVIWNKNQTKQNYPDTGLHESLVWILPSIANATVFPDKKDVWHKYLYHMGLKTPWKCKTY